MHKVGNSWQCEYYFHLKINVDNVVSHMVF